MNHSLNAMPFSPPKSFTESRYRKRPSWPLSVIVALVFVSSATGSGAQSFDANPVPATDPDERLAGMEARVALKERSLVRNVPFTNLGPTVMSGRVSDIDANPANPTEFYVAYASGGLWYTDNNGATFEPLFDHEASMTIGDIAVDWRGDRSIWVGTGENNSSRSSYSGTGLYVSVNGGLTWEHRGLAGMHRTGRIVLHPSDPGTVWVAAAGNLYSPSTERGVYVSHDRGETWTRTLYVSEYTGAIDLVIDPTNPDILLAAMWERERRAWDFVESGNGSGIYRSTDGGMTWSNVSSDGSGVPHGEGLGRIGLAIFPGDPSIVYALVDNQNRRADEEEDEPTLTRDDLRDMRSDEFLALADEDIEQFLDDNGFPDRYDLKTVRRMVEDRTIAPLALVEYLEDANQLLFDTPVIGAEVYRSDDGGLSWRKTHEEHLDQVYNSYGYYFGEIRVAPDDPDRIYVLGVPLLKSMDGGQTFASIGAANVHVDHQAMWVNPSDPGHLIDGNDGGLNVTYDDGANWFKLNSPTVGQFYTVQVDDAEPYRVYGGLQDNGVWYGPSTYDPGPRWHSSGRYPYQSLSGGDGMQVEVDTRDNETVYFGTQFGFYRRRNTATGDGGSIRPQHELGERPLRFNWQSPIHLSRHNQDILYFGANRLFRSMNRGEDLVAISEDLTQGGRQGDVPYGTLTTIDESPLRFGLLYVGSDDGWVHVSRDGGASWQRISDPLPPHYWVSRVEASSHDESRVYVALNGYRWDNFDALVYRSDDYGATWQRIATDLPPEPVNVVLEDPAVESILYVGTDHGIYVSLDGGVTFDAFSQGLPAAPVHDLRVQEREADLVAGTHGRSIYRASVDHVHAIVTDSLEADMHVFEIDEVRFSDRWGTRSASWREYFEPSVEITFFAPTSGEATVRIVDADGTVWASRSAEADRGLNYFEYDLTADDDRVANLDDRPEASDNGNTYLPAGEYTIAVTLGRRSAESQLVIEAEDDD